MDFLVGGPSMPIVSDTAKQFFEENINHSKIEFLPVEIPNYSNKTKFWVVNVLEVIKCFDWDKSEYLLFDSLGPKGNKKIRKIYNLQFVEEAIGDKEIFYSEEVPVFLFISPKFEQKLLESDLKGFAILENETY